ncbi:MAG: DUF2807 domain-containing protein [Spirochaetales bacterium]|nr:DUF2807 domain-containing protein [Spirochaetales bacterium]
MNVSKKSITTLAIGLLSLILIPSVFAFGSLKSSGEITEMEKEFSSITDLTLRGISDFRIIQSDSASVTLKGDKTFVEALEMDGSDGYLYIESNVDYPVEVVVATPDLTSLVLSHESKGTISGDFHAESLYISMTSKSSLKASSVLNADEINVYAGNNTFLEAEVQAKALNVSSPGKSAIMLSGEAEKLTAVFNQGQADFNGLHVQKADLSASGSAVINASFPGNSITRVDASSDSSVVLNLNGILSVDASNDSTVKYSGNIEWAGKTTRDDAVLSGL